VYKPSLLLFFTLALICVKAQDYRLIYPERDITFAIRDIIEEDSLYFFNEVREVVTEADGTAYYFTSQVDTSATGLCTTDTSLLGEKMLDLGDEYRTCVFFNKWGDSLFIRTLISEGDTWTFSTFEDGSYIEASVVNYDEFGVLPEINDSLYRVKLNVFTAGGDPLPGVFPDETKFDISKQYGVTEIWDYYHFPAEGPQYFLRGLSNPDVGVTDVDLRAILDIKEGYEMHFISRRAFDDTLITTYSSFFLLDRSDVATPEGVDLTYRVVSYSETETDGSTVSVESGIDTIVESYIYEEGAFLDSLERVVMDVEDLFYTIHIYDTTVYRGVRHKVLYGPFSEGVGDDCLVPNDTDSYRIVYGDGLGVLFQLDSAADDSYIRRECVYFQKGLVTWGTPIDFEELGVVDIEDVSPAEVFTVFPNPTSGLLQIGGVPEGEATLTIFDLHGRQLQRAVGETNIDLSGLPAGIYLLLVEADGHHQYIKVIRE
jgi:hypothetical protein